MSDTTRYRPKQNKFAPFLIIDVSFIQHYAAHWPYSIRVQMGTYNLRLVTLPIICLTLCNE